MGDNDTAVAKLRQLIFDYPTSEHVVEARNRIAAFEKESGTPAPATSTESE